MFVTHADRDHVAGLLQLHQLNARDGVPTICYPRDCGSFPALKGFAEKFDPQSGPATWRGLVPGETMELGGNIFVQAESSEHVVGAAGEIKALRFILSSRKRVLRSEYRGMSGEAIRDLKKKGIEPTEEVTEDLLGYSGDTAALNPSAWSRVRVLIHECTFLDPETAKRAHANVPEVLAAAKALALEAMVLSHFSARYQPGEIREVVVREAARMELRFPVFVVPPGPICEDVLATKPFWPGSGAVRSSGSAECRVSSDD